MDMIRWNWRSQRFPHQINNQRFFIATTPFFSYMAVNIICFSQEGCMGCEEQASINQEVMGLLKVKIEEIDAVKNPEYIKQYNLRVTPTIIILKDGEEKERFQGVIHREELENVIKKYL